MIIGHKNNASAAVHGFGWCAVSQKKRKKYSSHGTGNTTNIHLSLDSVSPLLKDSLAAQQMFTSALRQQERHPKGYKVQVNLNRD